MDDRDKRLKIELPIFGLILAYLLALLYETLQLSPDPRLVPLIILIPAILITGAHMINLVNPGLLPSPGTFSDFLTVDEDETELKDDPRSRIKDSMVIMGWFSMLVALIYLVGFVAGTVIFTFLFLYTVGDQSWQQSLLVSAFLSVALYLIFIELINVRPFEAMVPLGLP